MDPSRYRPTGAGQFCFPLANRLQESGARITNMDDDNPDDLEAFIQCLHTSGTMHIQNWKISYDNRLKTEERGLTNEVIFDPNVLGGLESGVLPQTT